MFADTARMQRVLHKDQTYAAAGSVGIHVPRTLHPASLEEAAAAAPGLRYPVILKWADPNGAMQPLRRAGLSLDKLRYCADADELMAGLRRYEAVGIYPMVQEFCAGYGLGQFVLMRDGQAHCLFQHRRVHEWPPEGGISTLCVSLPPDQHAGLMEQSVALLRALDWEGVAMVEYRYDPATGRAALMEINGRFWGSLPLACQAGAQPGHVRRLRHRADAVRGRAARPIHGAGNQAAVACAEPQAQRWVCSAGRRAGRDRRLSVGLRPARNPLFRP
jgi:predicted ATP-grasp superfamily ATP-dependent carboligase